MKIIFKNCAARIDPTTSLLSPLSNSVRYLEAHNFGNALQVFAYPSPIASEVEHLKLIHSRDVHYMTYDWIVIPKMFQRKSLRRLDLIFTAGYEAYKPKRFRIDLTTIGQILFDQAAGKTIKICLEGKSTHYDLLEDAIRNMNLPQRQVSCIGRWYMYVITNC